MPIRSLKMPLRSLKNGAVRAVLLVGAVPMLVSNLASANFEERVLNTHNRERAMNGLPPLQWDDQLARDADKWAQYLARLGTLVHADVDPRDPDPQGENLWAGTAGYYGPEAMMRLWLAEKRNLLPGKVPHNSATGNFEDVGHYTQVVWRNSTRLGCAKARGRGEDFLVCRYAIGGNVIGQKPF